MLHDTSYDTLEVQQKIDENKIFWLRTWCEQRILFGKQKTLFALLDFPFLPMSSKITLEFFYLNKVQQQWRPCAAHMDKLCCASQYYDSAFVLS